MNKENITVEEFIAELKKLDPSAPVYFLGVDPTTLQIHPKKVSYLISCIHQSILMESKVMSLLFNPWSCFF